MGVDPYQFNPRRLGDAGGLPLGRWCGISLDHPLGVEPGTGRDLFARLLYGSRVSCSSPSSAPFITMSVAPAVGVIAGFSRGWAGHRARPP